MKYIHICQFDVNKLSIIINYFDFKFLLNSESI